MVRDRHFWTNFSTILIVDNVDNVEKAFKNPQKITFPPTKSLFYQHFRHFPIYAFRHKKST